MDGWGLQPMQVSVSGMQIMEVIVAALKGNFRIYLPTSEWKHRSGFYGRVGVL